MEGSELATFMEVACSRRAMVHGLSYCKLPPDDAVLSHIPSPMRAGCTYSVGNRAVRRPTPSDGKSSSRVATLCLHALLRVLEAFHLMQ